MVLKVVHYRLFRCCQWFVRGTKHGRPGPESHKTPVVALVERGGKVRAFPVERVTAATLKGALKANAQGDVKLMTDELLAYGAMEHPDHHTVNHSRGEYVRGEAHNTVRVFSPC